ncbi:hypothetical protein [Streptomyces sp. NPDC052114]|uniref:hypothetical protein n=1 Tax=unclassified Streptomyces TaxID=2593676 RepID=UPI00343D37E1
MSPQSRAHRSLLAVCGAFALLSLALVPLTLPLGWDELVYASRFSPYAPETPFSAPRTRGVPFLVAPVAAWSDSVVLLRAWLTLLATAGLYLGFRPWLRVLHRPSATAVAAGLYGTLWITLFYANAAMPNHYTAMGAAAAVGLFLWPRQSPATYAGIAAGLALAALMRPNDGAAVGVPLLLAALLVPAWRGRGRVLAVLGGLAAGVLPWVVEAYVRFGGVRERLALASEVQGHLRPLLSFVHQLTVLDGPLLCRPCDGDGLRPTAAGWLLLLTVLVGVGLWSVRGGGVGGGGSATGVGGRGTDTGVGGSGTDTGADGRGTGTGPGTRTGIRTAPTALRDCLLAVAAALTSALPYLLLVPYAAPRFLLPTHALLAPAAALGLLVLADRARAARWPRAATAALALALAGHLTAQLLLVHGNARIQAGARGDWARVAAVLHEHGVGGTDRGTGTGTDTDTGTGTDTDTGTGTGTGTTPCVLRGNTSVIPIAYASGCVPGSPGDGRRPTALVLRQAAPPHWARHWPRHAVPDTYAPGWVVHVRP